MRNERIIKTMHEWRKQDIKAILYLVGIFIVSSFIFSLAFSKVWQCFVAALIMTIFFTILDIFVFNEFTIVDKVNKESENLFNEYS